MWDDGEWIHGIPCTGSPFAPISFFFFSFFEMHKWKSAMLARLLRPTRTREKWIAVIPLPFLCILLIRLFCSFSFFALFFIFSCLSFCFHIGNVLLCIHIYHIVYVYTFSESNCIIDGRVYFPVEMMKSLSTAQTVSTIAKHTITATAIFIRIIQSFTLAGLPLFGFIRVELMLQLFQNPRSRCDAVYFWNEWRWF